MKRVMFFLLAVVMIFSLGLAGCGPEEAVEEDPNGAEEPNGEEPVEEEDPYLVGILTPSRITDEGWSQSAYEGMPLIEADYNVEYSLIERPARSDIPEHIRNFAVQEYDVVFPHGFDFTEATVEIAPEFPETWFINGGSQEAMEPNLASYDIDSLDIGFLAGVVAGLVTETDRIGHIAGVEFPQLVDSLNAFEAGAKHVNPDVELYDAWVGDWDDAATARELAVALADNDVDVIFENAGAGGHGVIEGAQDAGIYAIGVNRDKNYVAEDTVITSVIADYAQTVYDMFEMYVNDELEAKFYYRGAVDGVVYYAPFYQFEDEFDDEIMSQIYEMEQKIIDGEFVVSDHVESVFHEY